MIRPRIASVVSVVWLYLGSAWVLIGALGLYGYYSMQGALDALGAHKAEVPTIYLWFPLLTLVLGAAGIVGARGLLKCKESGRKLLRGVSFGTVALLFAFTWSVALAVTNAGDRHYSSDVSWEQMKTGHRGNRGRRADGNSVHHHGSKARKRPSQGSDEVTESGQQRRRFSFSSAKPRHHAGARRPAHGRHLVHDDLGLFEHEVVAGEREAQGSFDAEGEARVRRELEAAERVGRELRLPATALNIL